MRDIDYSKRVGATEVLEKQKIMIHDSFVHTCGSCGHETKYSVYGPAEESKEEVLSKLKETIVVCKNCPASSLVTFKG